MDMFEKLKFFLWSMLFYVTIAVSIGTALMLLYGAWRVMCGWPC